VKTKTVPTGMLIKIKKIRMEGFPKLFENPFEEAPQPSWRANQAVRGALQRLSSTEREVVERFHFCRETCAEIGAALGISEFRVRAILQEARWKLKEHLTPFVQKRYGISREAGNCRICRSENRKAIEEVLKTKTNEETWKKVLRKLQTEFRIRTNARSLIRHLNRHQSKTPSRVGGKPAKKESGGSTA